MLEKWAGENNKTLHQNTSACPKEYPAATLIASGRRSIAFNSCSLQWDLISAAHLLTWKPKCRNQWLLVAQGLKHTQQYISLPKPCISNNNQFHSVTVRGVILFQALGLRSTVLSVEHNALGSGSGRSLAVHTNCTKQQGWEGNKTTATTWSCRGD